MFLYVSFGVITEQTVVRTITHTSNRKKRTQRPKERMRERESADKMRNSISMPFRNTFIGYEFLFRSLFSRFITIKAINLILFRVSAFVHASTLDGIADRIGSDGIEMIPLRYALSC